MRKSVIAIIIIVLVVLYMSVFVVKEGERGITLRFGKVLRDDDNKPLVYEPGLHFKIPFIETVKMLDARIQTRGRLQHSANAGDPYRSECTGEIVQNLYRRARD